MSINRVIRGAENEEPLMQCHRMTNSFGGVT